MQSGNIQYIPASKDNKLPSKSFKKAIIGTFTLSALLGSAYISKGWQSPSTKLSENQYQSDQYFSEFLQFIAEYGKEYKDHEEFNRRYEIFQTNFKFISEHNSLPEEESEGIVLGINKNSDLNEEEFLSQNTGLIIPYERTNKMKGFSFDSKEQSEVSKRQLSLLHRNQRAADSETKGLSIPDHKDWYKEGHVTQPYDQAGCGACWAFSTAAAVESLASITGYDDKITEYSVQQLVDCDDDNYACGGGWMYEGFEYVSEFGILKKDDYKSFSHSHHSCRVTDGELQQTAHIKNIGYKEHDGRTNAELRDLLQIQPISVGILTTGSLNHYKSGILTEKYLRCSSENKEVNHGVLLVGYGSVGDSEGETDSIKKGSCVDYWIVRNSWGENWGQDGFFKLCADDVGSKDTPLGTCLINKYATWPTMNMDDIEEGVWDS